MAEKDETPAARERARARREQVLTAAGELFAEHGFHGASMSELARRAGMSVGHIYYWFENKDAIVEALVDREMAQRQGVLAGLSRGGDGGPGITEPLEDEVRRVLDRRQLALWLEILAEAARNPRIAGKLRDADTAAFDRLTAAVSARLPGLGKRAAAARAGAIAALFQGLLVRAVYTPDLDRAAVVRATRAGVHDLLSVPDTTTG